MEQGTVTYEMTRVVIDNVFLYRSQYRENKVGLEIFLPFSWRDLLGLKASKTPSLCVTVDQTMLLSVAVILCKCE